MAQLQFISHTTPRYSYLDSIRLALEGGCRWVQLRMKEATLDELRRTALAARELCRQAGATFIIDDHAELVAEVGADGVHLGKKDMPVDEARRLLGPYFLIGGTANTIDDVRALHAAGADYIGCGPFRFTTTKQGLSPILGLDGYRRILAAMREEGISLPLVAIGGIGFDDIPALLEAGCSGIALSGSVLRAVNPVAEMKKIVELLNTTP